MGVEQRKSVTGVDHPPALLGGTAIKPPERHGWEAISFFIYDKETGAFFTRTPKSWALIIIFYCIYYTCLAAFWYGMLQVFFMFLPTDQPKYTLGDSIIGTNPGVGMRPHQPDVTIDSSMIFLQYNAKDEKPSHNFETASNIDWAERYRNFIKKYENITDTKECTGDEYNGDKEPACRFKKTDLGPCGTFPYGYQLEGNDAAVNPCVLLKINRIYGWEPKPYEVADLDEDEWGEEDPMPENVKRLVREDPGKKVFLDCQGEQPADRQALEGKMSYYPADQGIPLRYFPFTQAMRNYHNPVVAVKFTGLPVGRLLHIECKLWAKGVFHTSKDRIGQVHFEILLDDEKKWKKED